MNGGQGGEVEGTWSASLEWLVRRLAPRFPELGFAEVRYRIKSWKRLDCCVEDARAAIERRGAPRTLLLGFSMGGAVAIAGRRRAGASRPSSASRPWIPDRLLARAAARQRLRRPPRLARPLPARDPGRQPGELPRAASSGRGRSASRATYTLIPGALHGIALRGRGAARCRCRARGRWARLVAAELERFQAEPAERRRRSSCAASGTFTFQTSRSFSSPRITHHEMSIWKRCEPVPRRGRERVVVVVPALAEDEQRDEPVVPRLVARAVVLAPEHVADRVHAEGRVLVEEDPEQPAPDERPRARPATCRRRRSRSRTACRA